MPSSVVKYPVKTSKITENGIIKYIYHNTVVVAFNPEKMSVVLNSGGWRTATTKHRMNQFAIEHNLNFGVHQEKGKWFVGLIVNGVYQNNKETPFYDGIEIPVSYDV